MDSPFKLLIIIIVVTAILYLIVSYFAPAPGDNAAEMKKLLDYSEANEGKLSTTTLTFKKDEAFRGGLLDTKTRSVRFECSSTETCTGNNVTIESRQMYFNEQSPQEMFFRCKKVGTINDCVIYVGGMPAQLEIKNVKMDESLKVGENASISFDVINTGKFDSINSSHFVRVYQIKTEEGKENEILKQEFTGRIEQLPKGESKTVLQQFSVGLSGKYIVKIIAEGEDSGKATAEQRFTAQDAISSSCSATSKGTSTLEGNSCRTQYNCSGCQFGFECSTKWKEKGVAESEITETYPESIFTQTSAVNGSCQ